MTKTTRLMLAVLAVCGTSAAMAQSSVTIYGRVNTSVEHQKLGNTSATGMVSNSSYIGFKGVEDLGNGLKAGFVLESQFNSDNGSGAGNGGSMNFARNSEINLSSGFGMLRLGSFDPASYLATADAVSMHNHDTGPTADYLYAQAASTGNTIAYRTPNIAGFDAEVQYRFGEKANKNFTAADLTTLTGEDKGGWNLGANYANGPLGLGFGYSTEKVTAAAASTTDKQQQYAVRASYQIADLTLAGYYQKQKHSVTGLTAKRDVYRLAAMYVIGASELHANYGKASKAKINGTKEGNSANQWTLAYNYNLSKRTKVYALYSNMSHTETAGLSSPQSFSLTATNNADKFRTMGVGVRHLF